jgi:hypothetical protein
MRRLLVLGIVLFGVVLTVATPAQAAARMQIGEIWYNSPGSDRGGNASLNHEWVQLHNGYVKIHTGKGTNTQTDRYWGKSWYVWNNTGDTATLRDNRGRLLDRCTFKGKSQGYVFC